jgi:hypothetical protein
MQTASSGSGSLLASPSLGSGGSHPPESGAAAAVWELRSVINRYDSTLRQAMSENIISGHEDYMLSSSASLKARAFKALDNLSAGSSLGESKPARFLSVFATTVVESNDGESGSSISQPPRSPLPKSSRYLGEVSDVHFFNQVKRLLQTPAISVGAEGDFDSYEQDGDMTLLSDGGTTTTGPEGRMTDNFIMSGVRSSTVEVPDVEEAEKLASVYFETVHIAYPFIPRVLFSRVYDKMRNSSGSGSGAGAGAGKARLDLMELALLCEPSVSSLSTLCHILVGP